MKKLILIIFNLLFISGCNSHSYKDLYNKNPAFYSYAIGNVNNNKPKIFHADEVYITPASCQKILTSLLAYKKLGENYVYKTPIYRTNKNDLIIEFSGDPTLKSEDLTRLLQKFKGRHFRSIILDSSKFQTSPYSENIMFGDIGTSYSVPVSSMIIDHNHINIKIMQKNNHLEVFSDVSYKIIISDITITNDPTEIKIKKLENKNIILEGNINSQESIKEIKISPDQINDYIFKKLNKITKDLCISGVIKIVSDEQKISQKKFFIDEFQSVPLIKFLPPALKESDNLFFDSLYLTMVNSEQVLKNWDDGNKIIHKLAQEYLNIDLKKALIVDGCGLSRYNRIQTRTLYEILRQGYYMPAFVHSFPTAHEKNTTLQKRDKLLSTIKAKTGSIQGISTLCGYNNLCSNNPQIFVIHVINFVPPGSDTNNLIDEFISSKVKVAN